MNILSLQQVVAMQDDILKMSGGLHGIRDRGALESALAAPFQTFGDLDVYPTLFEKAARLGYGLIRNHAFLDGNKRIGTHAMLVFLDINGVELEYQDDELIQVIEDIAAGRKEYSDLLSWINDHVITE